MYRGLIPLGAVAAADEGEALGATAPASARRNRAVTVGAGRRAPRGATVGLTHADVLGAAVVAFASHEVRDRALERRTAMTGVGAPPTVSAQPPVALQGLSRSWAELLRRQPGVADTLVPLVLALLFLVVPALVPPGLEGPGGRGGPDLALSGADVALTIVSALALTQRRRRPLLTLLITGAVAAVALAGDWHANLAQMAVAVAVFNYGLRRARAQAVLATAVTSVGLGAMSVLAVTFGQAAWGRQDVVLWLCTAAAVAVAVQSRRATILALEDRARRAEESREETARRRVAEDRLRIARELHDVIAHHVAVISVQAGVAEHLLERNPTSAREALSHVRSSAKDVLAELQSVLGVLRQDETALPTAPPPGLSGLDELVASFRAMGVSVDFEAPATIPALSPAADVAAFRLVQEALTNAQKHAPGAAAAVQVRACADGVELVVTNTGPPRREEPALPKPDVPAPVGSGLGLVGMRERVTAAGGVLETGRSADAGFRVAARLPALAESR